MENKKFKVIKGGKRDPKFYSNKKKTKMDWSWFYRLKENKVVESIFILTISLVIVNLLFSLF